MKIQKKYVKLHPKQYEAFNFTTQFCAAISGVQGGKTFVGSYWAANNILEGQTQKESFGLICAPTYKILQQSTLPKFFAEFPQFSKYYKKQENVIELSPTHKTYVRSMDNPYGVEGMTLDWAWGDEAGQFPLMAWIVLRSRTAIKKGRVFFTTTPYNMGWLFQDFYQPWQEGEPDLTVVTWPSIANPYFPQEIFDREKRLLTKEEFGRRYMGEFTRMHGLVYDVHDWHLIPTPDFTFETVIGGVDWGWHKPALVVVGYRDGKFFVIDEWSEPGKTTGDIIKVMKNLQMKHRVNLWYADSANPENIAEANRSSGLRVHSYEKTKDSLTYGISILQGLLNEHRLFIVKSLKGTISETETYHYPEPVPDKAPVDVPVDIDNDFLDAIRYAIIGYAPAKMFTIPEKPKTFFDKVEARIIEQKKGFNKPAVGASYE